MLEAQTLQNEYTRIHWMGSENVEGMCLDCIKYFEIL